ncbi:MAG: ABC transporter permease [Bacteroidota bacterium]
MNTNQKIGTTFLTSRMRQFSVAVLSVTFGISMYICMNSFMSGVNNEQTKMAFTAIPHINIYNEVQSEPNYHSKEANGGSTVRMVSNERNINYTEGIRNVDEIKDRLVNIDHINGYTAQLNQNVFIRNGVSKTSANLSGIEPTSEDQMFNTAQYLMEGQLQDLNKGSNSIILGTGLAQKIGASTGDNVTVTTSDGIDKSFKIIGLIETGSGADKSRALVSIQTARQLFSKNRSYATELMVNLNDFDEAVNVAAQISQFTTYKVESWQESNGQLDSANGLRSIIAISVSLAIIIVAGFGIYNIMNMTVNEKIKEIAILKAIGFNGKDVIEIFLIQSVIIGFVGGLTGLALGHIMISIIDRVPFQVGPLDSLPISISPSDYLLAFLFGIIITFLAGFLPARSASKVDPVAILRG